MNKDESNIDLSVVLFLEEDDAPAVVASSWLRFRDRMCYWPSHIKSECKREKLVHSSAVPDPEEGWELCPMRVLQKGISEYKSLLIFILTPGHLHFCRHWSK